MGPPAEPSALLAQVVLLAGPSGCGKTYLALGTGLPVVALDDFYRDGTEPDLPRRPDGLVDWDHPKSWDPDRAVAALDELCRTGRVEVPTYRFGEDRAVGHHVVTLDGATLVVAEGIFAAELIEPLRAAGLLAEALLVHDDRWLTYCRRLVRDVREGRKPPWYLVRQGWAKSRDEPRVVSHLLELGARPVTKAEARVVIADLARR